MSDTLTPAEPAETTEATDTAPVTRLPRHFEWIVGGLVLVLGLWALYAVPAMGGYDEGLHFLRAWQISDGGIFASIATVKGEKVAGGREPSALFDDLATIEATGALSPGHSSRVFDHLGDPAPSGERPFIAFNSSAIYPPVPYLPAAFAIRVGRLFGLSTLAMVLLARLAQLLVYAGIVVLAIRRIPRRKLVLAICALAPVTILQAATVNADALTIALTLLVTAEAFQLADLDTADVRAPQLLEAGAAVLALALAKQPYVLVAAFLLVPMWRHRGRVAAWLGAELGVGAVLALGWSAWAQHNYIAPNYSALAGLTKGTYAYVNVDSAKQLAYVRGHPFSFLAAIARTFHHTPVDLFRETFVQSPGLRPAVLLAVLAVAVLVAAVLVDGIGLAGALARWIALGVVVVLTVATFLTAYAGWNAVGAPRVDAFQGRYLFPIVTVVAIVLIPTVRTRLSDLRFAPVVLGGAVVTSALVTTSAYLHFY